MPVPMALAKSANIDPRMAPGSIGPKALFMKPFLVGLTGSNSSLVMMVSAFSAFSCMESE